MKRLFALALALIALLGVAARAESNASIVRVADLALAAVSNGSARSVRFDDASLTLAIGDSNGASTVQTTFDNGEGQVVDGVLQIAGSQILLSMGGITGTFVIDLDAFAIDGSSGAEVGRGLSEALALAGSHLDIALYAITREGADGMRSVEVKLPAEQLIAAAERLFSVAEDTQAAQDGELSGLFERVENIGEGAVLSFRYSPKTGAFELSAAQNGSGVSLSGRMELSFEPMTFIDITADEEKYDLMNLSPQAQEQLRGELDIVLTKFVHFADGTGLDAIM